MFEVMWAVESRVSKRLAVNEAVAGRAHRTVLELNIGEEVYESRVGGCAADQSSVLARRRLPIRPWG